MFNSFKKCLPIFMLAIIGCFTATAQERVVNGVVRNAETQEPVAGVTVTIKGNNSKMTATNDKGEFTITVPANETVLRFTSVGFAFQEFMVGEKSTFLVSLAKETRSMEDVVVVGYGTKKRANVLGSVGTVNPKEIEDLPVANLATALVNKVPGVSITQSSGKPGSTTNLRIRNPVTFGSTGSINPLYVIDGIAYNDPDGKTFFDNLDATMVESISFLKDAAASVYGARGANGVVLVTTKKGRPGKPRISYTGSYGISDAANIPQTLSAYEHAQALNNKYLARPTDWSSILYTKEEMEYLKTHDYNWIDEVWQNSSLQRHAINITGGSDRITFFGGANYYNETGNLQDLYAKRYGVRLGTNAKITDNLTAEVTFSLDNSWQDRPTPKNITAFAGQNSDQNDEMNATIGALMLIPRWVPLYIDGRPVFTTAPGWHPFEVQNTGTYARTKSNGQSITASLNYKVPFIDGLSFRVNYGQNTRTVLGKEYYVSYNLYDFQRTTNGVLSATGATRQAVMFSNQLATNNAVRAIRNGNSLREATDQARSYQLNESINYKKRFGKHDFDLLVLAEQSESESESYFTSVEGQVIPNVDELWGFTQDKSFWDHLSSSTETGRVSYLGRLNYSFNDRYLLEASLRADASPNFPPASRWGYFPSVAVGWKISEEEFFKNVRFVDNLKLRVQVGATGSDAVANYQYYERYTQTTGMLFGTVNTNGLNNNRIPNPNITWEKAKYTNFGADGTFLNNRFNFSLDYYIRHNTDMLQTPTSSVPTTLGVAIADQNYAEVKAWGFEGALTYNGKVGKDFTYSLGANLGWTDNKVLQKFFAAATDTGWKYPIGRRTDNGIEGLRATKIFRTQAEVDEFNAKNPGWTIDGQPLRVGNLNFEDINGDGKITTDGDRTRIAPRGGSLFGIGFNIGAAWRGLRISINSSLSMGGNRIYDNTARRPPTENQGALHFWKDTWSPENPNARYPVINSPYISETSSFWMVSGTSMRINNAQLSYTLPQALKTKYRIPEMRVFVVGTNLWNIINNQPYKDLGSNVAVDYPVLRTYTFGLNVTL
jgi:TonB-dependent starch-binding outer membrane protein SusC